MDICFFPLGNNHNLNLAWSRKIKFKVPYFSKKDIFCCCWQKFELYASVEINQHFQLSFVASPIIMSRWHDPQFHKNKRKAFMIPFLLRMEQIVRTQVPGKKGVKGVADTFNPRFCIELRGIRSKRYCRIGIENILLRFLTTFLPFKKENLCWLEHDMQQFWNLVSHFSSW